MALYVQKDESGAILFGGMSPDEVMALLACTDSTKWCLALNVTAYVFMEVIRELNAQNLTMPADHELEVDIMGVEIWNLVEYFFAAYIGILVTVVIYNIFF